VELFFKWIKQHLKTKTFYGTWINAVMTQLWVAISVSVYLLVAIARRRLGTSTQAAIGIRLGCDGDVVVFRPPSGSMEWAVWS